MTLKMQIDRRAGIFFAGFFVEFFIFSHKPLLLFFLFFSFLAPPRGKRLHIPQHRGTFHGKRGQSGTTRWHIKGGLVLEKIDSAVLHFFYALGLLFTHARCFNKNSHTNWNLRAPVMFRIRNKASKTTEQQTTQRLLNHFLGWIPRIFIFLAETSLPLQLKSIHRKWA